MIVLAVLGLASCINIRTEYPEITFYQLSGEPSIISTDMKIDAALQIRDAEVADGIDTDHLIAMSENAKIKKYFYHRWTTDVASLTTDFFKKRYTELNVFRNGVINASSAVIPDFYLELRLVQMDCFSSTQKPKDSSYVEVVIQATLIKSPVDKTQTRTLAARSFKSRIKRPDAEIKSIVPAYNKAFSELTDMIFADFYAELSAE